MPTTCEPPSQTSPRLDDGLSTPGSVPPPRVAVAFLVRPTRTWSDRVARQRRSRRFRVLLIDETSLRRRYRYVTVILNGDTGETLVWSPTGIAGPSRFSGRPGPPVAARGQGGGPIWGSSLRLGLLAPLVVAGTAGLWSCQRSRRSGAGAGL
jgi:hypothetical protein